MADVAETAPRGRRPRPLVIGPSDIKDPAGLDLDGQLEHLLLYEFGMNAI
jgi:hypothetical protein